MPSRRGRKRRPESRNRERAPAPAAVHSAAQSRTVSAAPSTAAQPLPSKSARFTGLMIAVVTAFLSVLLIADALSNAGSVDGVTRIVAGALMVLIALIVGVLSVFPAQIARMVRKRSAGA